MTQEINKTNSIRLMLEKEGMSFSTEKGWNTLAGHVDVHHRDLSEKLSFNVSWDDALFSWYENIYTPLNRAVSTRYVQRKLRDMPKGDIYLAVSEHLSKLKDQYGDFEESAAAADYAYKNRVKSKNIFTRFFDPTDDGNGAGNGRRKAA